MAGLKELRTRIEAVKSTQKITSAMKMVAASRLRRVQILVENGKQYSENLRHSALRIITDIENEEKEKNIKYIRPQLLQQNENPQNYTLYVFSSNRGLCGAYNANIAKKARERIDMLQKANKNVTVICFGKKAYDILRRFYADTKLNISLNTDFGDKLSYTEAADKLANKILADFSNRKFDVCEFIYAGFVSAISRNFCYTQVCPLCLNKGDISDADLQTINRCGDAYYEYMPDKMTLLTQILPPIFKVDIKSLLVNSAASEHSARMSSMDSATRNAKKIIDDLTLKYNSMRQSAITTELIEIIAGAEAV
jgi:F-type H+-transporting ATPase subunit gamma